MDTLILPPSTNITALPFQLRANDIQKHIVNIDSRFRDDPKTADAANFYFSLLSPIKNILRIRITSIEFPNNFYTFSYKRKNTIMRILYTGSTGNVVPVAIEIDDGTYTAFEMELALNTLFQEPSYGLDWLTAKFDPITGHFVFTGTKYFGIDATYHAINREFDYGLTYYLGFSKKLHRSYVVTPGTYRVVSDQLANFSGDSYVLLRLNDFNCVRHSMYSNDLNALAKIVIRDQKNYMSFDDYSGQHAKEVVFPTPQDLSRMKIQVLDAYGELIDMEGMNFSFSIEVLEIKNLNLYNAVRDSLAIQYSGAQQPSQFF